MNTQSLSEEVVVVEAKNESVSMRLKARQEGHNTRKRTKERAEDRGWRMREREQGANCARKRERQTYRERESTTKQD